ncbi:MAG: fatty acid desaturase [Phycisphaera sp. RhM]|nr:fatty acid desaturase [Phycisphaera sp. RhM]
MLMDACSEHWVHDSKVALRDADVDYFHVSSWIYWRDFLVSIALAYTAATVYLTAEAWSAYQIIAFPIAVFWLYRAGSLVHEVAHLGEHEMRAYKVAWNLIAGVMMLAPSPFFSAHHRDHHTHRLYGTKQDPEYIVNCFRRGNWTSMFGYALLVLAFPIIVTVRFIITPLTFLHPRLRTFVLTRCSSLMMNPYYVRRVSKADRRRITAVELLTCIRATLIPALVLLGINQWSRIPMLYSLGISVLLLNQLRLLADHHFESDGTKMTPSDHMHDSCNFTGRDFFTWLLYPFSIRFHALHHLFPSLPYHNLRAADQYLMQILPADSPYRDLQQPSWFAVARKTIATVDRSAGSRNPTAT